MRIGVDNGQHPELPACSQLIVHEVHGPGLVRPGGYRTIVTKLGLHAPLGCLVAKLQTHLLVESVDPLRVHTPALAVQQHMNASISVANAGLRDLPDTLFEIGLVVTAGLVMIARSSGPQHGASSANANGPDRMHIIDKLPATSRP